MNKFIILSFKAGVFVLCCANQSVIAWQLLSAICLYLWAHITKSQNRHHDPHHRQLDKFPSILSSFQLRVVCSRMRNTCYIKPARGDFPTAQRCINMLSSDLPCNYVLQR